MNKDYDEEVRRDMEKFKASGRLPKDYDVQIQKEGGGSPYWAYLGGRPEPTSNSGATIEPHATGGSTNKGRNFRQWLEWEFPRLTEEDKELFHLVWEKGVPIKHLASYLGVSVRTVHYQVLDLKQRIARWVGITL